MNRDGFFRNESLVVGRHDFDDDGFPPGEREGRVEPGGVRQCRVNQTTIEVQLDFCDLAIGVGRSKRYVRELGGGIRDRSRRHRRLIGCWSLISKLERLGGVRSRIIDRRYRNGGVRGDGNLDGSCGSRRNERRTVFEFVPDDRSVGIGRHRRKEIGIGDDLRISCSKDGRNVRYGSRSGTGGTRSGGSRTR